MNPHLSILHLFGEMLFLDNAGAPEPTWKRKASSTAQEASSEAAEDVPGVLTALERKLL